jgi:hypothetical protein
VDQRGAGPMPDDPEWRQRLDRDWDSVYGDRRQELVFIGAAAEIAEMDIHRGLDACLVGSAAAPVLDEEAWRSLPDPFPVWERGESGEET